MNSGSFCGHGPPTGAGHRTLLSPKGLLAPLRQSLAPSPPDQVAADRSFPVAMQRPEFHKNGKSKQWAVLPNPVPSDSLRFLPVTVRVDMVFFLLLRPVQCGA